MKFLSKQRLHLQSFFPHRPQQPPLAVLLTVVTAISLAVIIYTHSWVGQFQPDPAYLQDYYSFSQWAIPLSSRTMGDSELYQHASYQLVESFAPFALNPEVPVLGKLMYGWAMHSIGNPLIISIILWLVLIAATDQLAQLYFNFTTRQRWVLALVLGTAPIVIEQLSVTLMDLPQAVFMLLHITFLFASARAKSNLAKWSALTLAAMFLGAMSATKIAVYWPVLLVLDAWYLHTHRQLKLWPILVLALGSAATYLVTYTPYVLSNGLLTWLRAQKWMAAFYLNSDVQPISGMMLISAVTGWYQGWWGAPGERLATWNGSWALWLLAIATCWREWLRHSRSQVKQSAKLLARQSADRFSAEKKYLIVLTTVLLLAFNLIPFWPRYLVLTAPLAWLLIVDIVRTKPKVMTVLMIFPIISAGSLLWHSLQFNPQEFYGLWEKAAFEEMYTHLSQSARAQTSRQEWVRQQLNPIRHQAVHRINIRPADPANSGSFIPSSLLERSVLVDAVLTGQRSVTNHRYRLNWTYRHGQWRLDSLRLTESKDALLNWPIPPVQSRDNAVDQNAADLADLAGLSADVTADPATNHATNTSLPLCVLPTKVTDWGATYKLLSRYLPHSRATTAQRVMGFVPREYCRPVGWVQRQSIDLSQAAAAGIFVGP